jgi:hypothetical protein
LTAGEWYGDAEADKGIKTGPDARFFAYYATLETPFNNEGKDLVVQVISLFVGDELSVPCGVPMCPFASKASQTSP